MKRKLILIILLILAAFGGIAQTKSSLEVRNYRSQKSNYISEGSKICVIKNGKLYKGALTILSDKAILVNSDTILISNIQQFYSRTFSTRLGGGILLTSGSLIGGLGLAATVAGISDGGGYALLAVLLGVPIAALGIIGVVKGVKYLSRGKKFDPSKWEYRILTISH